MTSVLSLPACPALDALLSAVRGWLWRREFVVAARAAAWGSVTVLTIAVAVHMFLRPLALPAMILAVGAWWVATFARATWRRPTIADCARWADRNLQGASAYGTVLDLRGDRLPLAAPAAAAQLAHWAEHQAAASRTLLSRHHEPSRLAVPLAGAAVASLLTAFVLALPGAAPATVPTQAATAARNLPASSATSEGATRDVAAAVAGALRDSRRAGATQPRPAGGAVPGMSTAEAASSAMEGSAQPPTRAADAARATNPRSASPGQPLDMPAPPSTDHGATAGGRDAGDSPDRRADVGRSNAAPATMAPRHSDVASPTLSAPQASVDETAAYGDTTVGGASAATIDVALPAAPPPAATAQGTRLSPSESAYLKAWMQAQGRRP